MRVDYITNIRFPTEKAHGWQIAKMCEALALQGHEVRLVVPARQTSISTPWEAYYQVRPCFEVVSLPVTDAFARVWLPRGVAFVITEYSFRRAVAAWWRQQRQLADWVLTRDQFLAPWLACHYQRVAFEAHDIPPSFFKRHWRLARSMRLIVTTNQWKRDTLRQTWAPFLRAPVTSLPNGIDVTPYLNLPSQEEARTRLGWEKQRPTIVYSGHLYAWKGVFVLAEASAFLPDDYQVVFLGGFPEDRAALERFASGRQLSRLRFIPHIPPEQVPLHLAAADALVLPNSGTSWNSRYTTSPIKLWEYLAARRPVVVSDLPSLRELVAESEVVFVPSDDPRALAQALARVISEPSTERVTQAWERVQQRTWQARAERLAEIFSYGIHLS